MGAFDWLGQSLDWAKNRYWEQGVKKTWNESWGSFVGHEQADGSYTPGVFEKVGEGLVGMVTAPFYDDGDFWGSGRMWLDGMVEGGSGLVGGTVGTLFQIPILHEAAWLLDKAYRYAVARPISTAFLWITTSQLEAYEQGRNSDMDLLAQMGQWNSLRQAWNDSAYVTPGQSIVYASGGLFQDMGDDLHSYLREYDPRTEHGQKQFNSPEADFWLKYTSGTLDFGASLFADPAHGASLAAKAAKLKYVDKVATPKYIAADGVTKEIGTSTYKKVFDEALRAKTPEEFRDRAMPNYRNGGQVSTLLWTAARMGEDIYKDTYLTVRGFDPKAYQRLADQAPKIADAFTNIYANFTLADMDFQRGLLDSETSGANVLQKSSVDAFVQSWAAEEGIWGTALGKGALEPIPKVRKTSAFREGYHSKVLFGRPIFIGRPIQKAAQMLLPSQGWTPRIDPMDGTGIGLKQFKANLERTRNLTPDEINLWTSRYGAATSDATRHTVAMRAEELVVSRMLDKHGLSKWEMPLVLRELNKFRAGSRRLWGNERRYISEEAARAAERAITYGRANEAEELLQMTPFLEKQMVDGTLPGSFVPLRDGLGRTMIIPIMEEVGEAGATRIKRNEPILRSQFADAITMLDYRAFESGLRWWNITHPKPRSLAADVELRTTTGHDDLLMPPKKFFDEIDKKDTPKSVRDIVDKWTELAVRDELTPAEVKAFNNELQVIANQAAGVPVGVPRWQATLAQAARLRGFYDGAIGLADSAMILWKATALMRPAQAPRNVADDLLRMMIHFGKLPVLMSAGQAVPNIWKNWARNPGGTTKTKLLVEVVREKLALQHQTGELRPKVQANIEDSAPGNLDLDDATYMSPTVAFANGALSYQDYYNMLISQMEAVEPLGRPKYEARKEKNKKLTEDLAAAQKSGRPLLGAPVPRKPYHGEQFTDTPYSNFPYSGPAHLIERALIREFLGEASATTRKKSNPNTPTLKIRLAENALRVAQRPAQFIKRPWQYKVLRTLVDKHFKLRESGFRNDDPYAPATLVVDPLSGAFPEELTKNLRDNFDISQEAVLPTADLKNKTEGRNSVYLAKAAEAMREWVDLNLDELLKPNTLMTLRVKPNGHIAIGFARAKKHVTEAGETVKVSARERFRDFKHDEIQDMAHTGFDIVDKQGNVVATFKGVFDGPTGQQLFSRVSARVNPSQAYGQIVDPDIDALVNEQGSWTQPMTNEHVDYPVNWERSVNAQIASDPVARKFLEGKTNVEVLDWVETTREGSKWVKAMSFRGIAYADQVMQIEKMVDTYLPNPVNDLRNGVNFEKAQALREAALRKEARYDMLNEAMPDRTQQPEIHGLSVADILGTSYAFKLMRGLVGKIQKVLSDLPVDKVARFPFMAMAYTQHAKQLYQIANETFGGTVPAGAVEHIKRQAQEMAYYDMRYRLYDTAQRNDFAMATRLFMPFSAAMMDSYIKYGRNIRQNPMLLAQGAYYWTMFERNQMVQDENGYVAEEEDGRTVWYAVDPDTGARTRVPEEEVGKERYVQFQLPSFAADLLGMDTNSLYGVEGKSVIAINKQTMNVFLNLPGAGPLVAYPANQFALSNPEFADYYAIEKFVLPFGPNADGMKVVWPSTVRSAWEAFVAEDGNTASGHAAAIMQAELTGWALGTRSQPPSFEEVREKAANMRLVRFFATWVSPASFQTVSPYQMYVDAYRQLVQENPQTAAEEFMRRYGDEFYAMTMSVTRNVSGITAGIKSHKKYLEYKGLIEQYPEMGGLITGADGGEFSKAVYEAQKLTPVRPGSTENMRQLMSIGESVENLQAKTVWAQYSKLRALVTSAMVDRGIRNLQSRAARDLKASIDAFVKANKYWIDPATGEEALSPWYMDYMSSDKGKIEKKFEGLRKIVKDPDLIKRDDIRGLANYLAMRNDMQAQMRRFGYKSLASAQATRLRNRWNEQVHDLVESNDEFAVLHSRWLSNDDTLELGGVNA